MSVVVADDRPVSRFRLSRLISAHPRLRVVGEVDNADTALALTTSCRPGVLVLHLRRTPRGALEVARRVTTAATGTAVVIVTVQDERPHRATDWAAAADCLFSDPEPASVLSSIVKAAGTHGSRPSTGSTPPVARAPFRADPTDGLSPREAHLIGLIGRGLNNSEIAAELRISEKTVRNHVSRLYARIRVANRSQAILWAIKAGTTEL